MELDALGPSLPSRLSWVCQGNAGNKTGFPTERVSGANPKLFPAFPNPRWLQSLSEPDSDIPKVTPGWILLPCLSGIDSGVPDGMGDLHPTFAIPRWISHPFGTLSSKILGRDHRELHRDENSQNPREIQEISDLNSHRGFQESTQGIPDSLWHLVGKEPGPTFPKKPEFPIPARPQQKQLLSSAPQILRDNKTSGKLERIPGYKQGWGGGNGAGRFLGKEKKN